MDQPIMIAIDGPAGSGKSTVAKRVAAQLGYTYLDTGAMYRAIALAIAETGGEPGDVAQTARLEFRNGRMHLEGRDVSDRIRTPEVSQQASKVSALPEVRRALVSQQQRMIATGDHVAEGRDVGTVIAPHAQVKVFLTASPAERARRRAAQTGQPVEQVLAEQTERDTRDMTRKADPLRVADDAVELDTTGMTVEQVIDRICDLARAAEKGRS